MDFAQRLKKCRLDKGWSQTELANRIGLSPALISKYEAAKVSPSFEIITRLANSLEISADYLLHTDFAIRKDAQYVNDPIEDVKDLEKVFVKLKSITLSKSDSYVLKELIKGYIAKYEMESALNNWKSAS